MTYIINNPNEAQRLLFERWQAEGLDVVAVEQDKTTDQIIEVLSNSTSEGLDFHKFDDETKRRITESMVAYRSGNKDYFTWQPEHEELKQDLLARGIPLVCGE